MAHHGLEALGLEVLQVIADQADQHGILVQAPLGNLHKQAFLHVPGRNAHGIKELYAPEHGQHLVRIDLGHDGYLVHRGLQIARGGEVADDALANGGLFLAQIGEVQLPEQMAFQGRLLRIALHGRKRLLFLDFPLLIVPGGTGKVAQIVLPVGIAGGFLVIDPVPGLLGTILFLMLQTLFRQSRCFPFFQEGVFQEFLMNGFHKLLTRELQKTDCLLQLLGHHEFLLQFQLLTKFQGHNFCLSSQELQNNAPDRTQ